ncbi:hypothetical protein SLNSH_10360 [Alsobacter soli]|uniref:Uncharacterized protein n=1 Tax=Alsobacter soli TaxID=2109933 RepID=A0A2T1HU73_9HYPH|nr:hypothetical protein [Alsobacter soli]PSC05205.1 hypothetical protein SLNSH_10360 [Alsobacter soli]
MIRLLISDRSGTRVGQLPRWAVGLGLAALAGLGLLIAVIGFSLVLLLAPVVLAAGAIARWPLRKVFREMEAAQASAASAFDRRPPPPRDVIEGEYRVIEEPRAGPR